MPPDADLERVESPYEVPTQDRKQPATEALEERVAVLEEVFRATPSFIHVLQGPEFVFEFANEAYYQLVGRRDLIGRPAFAALPEAARAGYEERISRVMATGEPFYGRELPVTLARTSGAPPEQRIIDLVYLPLADADGTCTRVLGHGTDVTERVREREAAEGALRESEQQRLEAAFRQQASEARESALRESAAALQASETRYRTLFESIDEGFCVIEVLFDAEDRPFDYRFLEVNPAFEVHTGIKDGLGHTVREFAPDHEDHWYEIYGRVARTGEPVRFEQRAEALGRFYDVYAFRVGEPGQHRVAVLFNDVTQRKQAVEALREADLRKDEFLATLAHELRNPLAPLVTALEVLRLRASDPAAVAQSRETIGRQVEHMRRLIDDLLDVARITRGMVDLQWEGLDLRQVIEGAVLMARPMIEQRRQSLVVNIPPQPVPLSGDPHRLTQVVANLLTNAAKFTPPEGYITIDLEQGDAEALIRVRDTGKGIPPEMLPLIFDLFTQVNPPIDRTEGGLGLGLTLVRKLVRMHGGQVEARSGGVGQGSEFLVRLPLHRSGLGVELQVSPSLAASEQAGLRVLVVDDNVDAADTLAELLSLWGHTARVAYDGRTALAEVRSWRPDVVLLDIGLPGMDGYAVAREIRELPDLAEVRLLAVTGYGQDADRRRAREAGFDSHLTKPVDAAELRSVLETTTQALSGHRA